MLPYSKKIQCQCVKLHIEINFFIHSAVVGNLLVRAQVKSEPSPSDAVSGVSERPASSGSIHSVLPSVSVSSRILPLSTSPSPYNFGPTGPLSLGLNHHGLGSRDQDRAGSGRSSSNSGMGSPHSTPPPSIGSSQSDTSVGSSLHSTQYIKKEPQVSSTVPPHQTYSGQKFHENLSHSPLIGMNGGGGIVNERDNIVTSVTSDKNTNSNIGYNRRDSIENTVPSSNEIRFKNSIPDSLTSDTSSMAVSTNSISTSISKGEEKRINNNTSSYNCGGRLKFFKGKK